MPEPNRLNLNNILIDRLASGAKGITGAVPFVGSIIAEIVGNVIPNQRIDRLTRFVRTFHAVTEKAFDLHVGAVTFLWLLLLFTFCVNYLKQAAELGDNVSQYNMAMKSEKKRPRFDPDYAVPPGRTLQETTA